MTLIRCALLAGFAVLGCTAIARADVRTYVIAIGNNDVPVGVAERELQPLRYADDDAAAFYRFSSSFASRAALLTVLDATSQTRFPGLADHAQAPTLGVLRSTIADFRARFAADRRAGHTPRLLFFFSGHGTRAGGTPSLALRDGALTQRVLYEELLPAFADGYVHLIVDACHAEAVVRPRDASAPVVKVSSADVKNWARSHTLDRFPNVGAVIASGSDQQAHEWDAYQAGVFTHAVLSALHGAADVNRDRRIEYSELHAFLAAATREVQDPRAKASFQLRVPALDRRVALVELDMATSFGWIVGVPPGRVHVEDERGVRLVDAHAEKGHTISFVVPASTRLFLRSEDGEAEFSVAAGETVRLDQLRLRRPSTLARGSVSSALHRGLFVTPFGPIYYRGFTDSAGHLSVDFTLATTDSAPQASTTAMWAAWSAAATLGVSSGVLGGMALLARRDWHATELQRPALDARDRYDTYRWACFATAGAAVTAGAVGLWLRSRSTRSRRREPVAGVGATANGAAVMLGVTW